MTAINSASSGLPVNVTYSPNSFQSVSTLLNQRPDEAPGNPVLPKSKRVKINGNQGISTLNTALFSLPDGNSPNTPYGNAGRNSIRFDPFYQLDMGLHKVFPLYPQGTSFDFRFEAFNILNQTNYSFPSSNLSSSSTFGVVTAATTGPARILQFAGKINF